MGIFENKDPAALRGANLFPFSIEIHSSSFTPAVSFFLFISTKPRLCYHPK